MLTCAKTNVGKIRENNEDSIFLSDEKIASLDNLYIVADGMGGHNSGEVASNSAINYFLEYLKTNIVPLDTEGLIFDGIFSLNKKIYARAISEEENYGMGTTFTLLTIKDNVAHFGHVGDSRAYILRDDKLEQITRDHTYVNEMITKGLMTEKQAKVDPMRNLVTRAIGAHEDVKVDYIEQGIEKDDIIILCSDGLSGLVSDEVIKSIVKENEDINVACDALINEALNNGGFDNISVVLIYV